MRYWFLLCLLGVALAQSTGPVVAPSKPNPSSTLAFEHDPSLPRYASVAAGQLSLRFQATEGSVAWAVLQSPNGNQPMHRQLAGNGIEVWRIAVEPSLGPYRIRVQSASGQPAVFGPYTVSNPLVGLDWVGGRIGYQVFLDRFWNGDPSNDTLALQSAQNLFDGTWRGSPPYVSNWSDPPGPYHCCQQYYGGDLAGLLQKLPHLQALGVGVIYFNPLFASGSAHGYDTHDLREISPKFGDTALMKQVIEQAHQLGMKLIFDYVPNHVGLGFWAFQDAVKNGPQSAYWDWFGIKRWPFTPGDASAYDTYMGVGSLPKLKTTHPQVQQHLLEVAQQWLELGFDGLRIDHPQGVVNREGFYRALRQTVRATNPQAYIVAEIWQRDPSWLQGDQADSLMNYTVGRDVVLRFARGGSVVLYNGRRALADLSRLYTDYSEAVVGMGWNQIGSHDTARVLTDLGGGNFGQTPTPESLQRLQLAAALLYALPGMPMWFQGDECGLNGERGEWPINELYRWPIQWELCQGDTPNFFKRLGQLHQSTPAFASPVFRVYAGEGNLLSFLRGEPNSPQVVLAVFNNHPTEARALQLPSGEWRDLSSGQSFSQQAVVQPIGFRYLQRVPQP